MANACKCDRCGSFYTPYFMDVEQASVSANGISITRRTNSFREHYEMDLCPLCLDSILSQIFMAPIKYGNIQILKTERDINGN